MARNQTATKRRRTSAASVPTDPPEASLTVGSSEPPLDQALELFMRRPPSAADHLVVTVLAFDGSEHLLADISRTEVAAETTEAANQIALSSRSWAANERRECRFRALWQGSDRILSSYAWRSGESAEANGGALDGTMQAMLAQNQRHLESLMRLLIEKDAGHQRSFDRLTSMQDRRILALETRANELAERLRAAGDSDNELATQTLAAELEGRARTQEILLTRVVPLIEAAAVRHFQSVSGAPQPTAADPSKPSGAVS